MLKYISISLNLMSALPSSTRNFSYVFSFVLILLCTMGAFIIPLAVSFFTCTADIYLFKVNKETCSHIVLIWFLLLTCWTCWLASIIEWSNIGWEETAVLLNDVLCRNDRFHCIKCENSGFHWPVFSRILAYFMQCLAGRKSPRFKKI